MPHKLSEFRGAIFAAVALATLLFGGCGANADKPKASPTGAPASMTVTSQRVAKHRLTEQLTLTGTIEAWQTLTVASELSGLKLVRVEAEIGDKVSPGTPLAYFDARDLQAQLEAAQARYRSAVANVERTRRPDRPQQVNALKAAVEQAKASVAQEEANLAQIRINQASASRTAQRYSKALEQGYVTALEADQRLTDRNAQLAAIKAAEQRTKAAKFALKQAQENLKLAQIGGRREDVAMAEAQRDEALAAVNQLRVQLDKTVVRAPDSGTILSQSAYLGNIANLGQELFTIARQGRLQLWAEVPQDRLDEIKIGSLIRMSSQDQEEFGTVEEIDPKVDSATRQGRVRVSLGRESKFRIGAFARGQLESSEVEVLAVEPEALQGQSDQHFVFLLDGNKVKKQAVTVGRRQGGIVEVLGGLSPGQQIVLGGAAFLSDGDTVQVATP